MIKFLDILSRYEALEFNQLEAAELLGVGERTFRRWCQRYEEDGEAGLLDRRLGKASGKRVPVDRADEVEALYRTRYAGFTAKHFHEHLVRDHRFNWGYTWTKTFLQSKGLLEKARRRGAHRRKRPRRPLPGMMLHQDGSRHQWLAGQPMLDLIVTLDDATSAIYSAFLVEEEGTASTFRALEEVFGRHGLPLSLYTDRGSHYFHTAAAGGAVDRAAPTQVGRALAHLGVEHIAAYSPQARGRSERVFHTLQDRLTKELALAGIATVDAANLFLRDVYLPAHNARFAIKPEQDGSAFVAISGIDLGEILCVQEERQVGNDNCVSFNRLKLQIPASPLRAHFVKARVKVRQYHDGTHAIFHGPRCLGRYDRRGAAVDIPIAA
ncbi:ISNCY family transposase [Bradyrhizobium sp.]|uniref:ISNCY family transposase n=1 Tax=Bradyrhizobium sp. TaxID=376 RepID=UPI004037A700